MLIAANRSRRDLTKNRRPTVGVVADAAQFVQALAATAPHRSERWALWVDELRQRDQDREQHIAELADEVTHYINPLALCSAIDRAMHNDSLLVLDGGDFVATASYSVRPRGPLSFLDPGVFGTLGVGAGFALGAKLCRPDAEVWILYGDGSAAYSLAEFDTFVRHGIGVIAVVGNDAAWTQIARGQREILGDEVGTVLRYTDYDRVAQGYGAQGLGVRDQADLDGVLQQAKRQAREGVPVLVNALIGTTDFRAGSVSM